MKSSVPLILSAVHRVPMRMSLFASLLAAVCFAAIPSRGICQTIEGEGVPYFYEREPKQEREAYELPFVREADVVWQQTIWRTIDFREKFNHFFYYPTEREGYDGRKNFAYMVWDAVASGEIANIYEDDEFKVPLDAEVFIGRFLKPDTMIVDDDENYEYKSVIIPKEFNADEVLQIHLKESWYIDKQVTEQNVRIVGLALTKEMYKERDGEIDYLGSVVLFWIPMLAPDVRRVMVRNEATWEQNVAHQPSWENIFISRKFNSYIYRYSNLYNRTVSSYLTGTDALIEAERIENYLLDLSQDMWEY